MKKALLAIAFLVVSDVAPEAAAQPPPVSVTMPAWAASLPADDALTDARRDAIQHEARAFVLAATAEQRRTFLAHLTQGATCGRAHAAAVAGALTAGIEPALVTEALETMSTECDEVIVESAGFVPNPDARVAAALARLTHDDRMHEAAWLSFGSIAETARSGGDAALAGSIDAAIAGALASSTGDEHLLLVRAAGNAGCVECAPILARDATAEEPLLRRAAIAAHRFLPSEQAVDRMCSALGSDEDASARDLAAWALEWRTTHPEKRAGCLERAALDDEARGVRLQAVRALGILADDAPAALDALERLAVLRGEVGRAAARTLAIRAPLDESDGEIAYVGER